MATATLRTARLTRARQAFQYGPSSAGIEMTAEEFDHGDFVEGWRYELIDGVLVVSPTPLPNERDPNEELGYWLRSYRDHHPQGKALDKTLFEHELKIGRRRRRIDRVIWAGLGRRPRRGENPTIAVEFVSAGKRNAERDYERKRREYFAIHIKEYWIFDRFRRTLTVLSQEAGKVKKRILTEGEIYTTPLLPGFELDVSKLLAIALEWPEEEEIA